MTKKRKPSTKSPRLVVEYRRKLSSVFLVHVAGLFKFQLAQLLDPSQSLEVEVNDATEAAEFYRYARTGTAIHIRDGREPGELIVTPVGQFRERVQEGG